jgi:hypothetical protein
MPEHPLAGSIDHRLTLAAQRLQAATDAQAVILFGSRARGDARPDSDWDLMRHPPRRRAAAAFHACLPLAGGARARPADPGASGASLRVRGAAQRPDGDEL